VYELGFFVRAGSFTFIFNDLGILISSAIEWVDVGRAEKFPQAWH